MAEIETSMAFSPRVTVIQSIRINCTGTIYIGDIPLCCNSKGTTKYFKITVKTQQQSVNISIVSWQHVAGLLDHLQCSIQRYEVQSVHIMYCGIAYYLKCAHKIV